MKPHSELESPHPQSGLPSREAIGLEGLPAGGLNIAHEAVDRHAAGPRGSRVALRWIDRDGSTRDYTYAELRQLTNRFANVLRSLGVGPGDRVYGLSERIPELYVAALGTLKAKAVFCPLFAAYGPEPIRARLSMGRGRVLVTTDQLYRRKVEAVRESLPELTHVLTVRRDAAGSGLAECVAESLTEGLTGGRTAEDLAEGGTRGEAVSGPLQVSGAASTIDFHAWLRAASDEFEIPTTDPEDPALIHFTSGTTGMPKGVVHVHRAIVGHHDTARLVLDLSPDDVFWCTADPGWVTGVSYGLIAPLAVGSTLLVDREEFGAERWYRILEEHGVNVLYTAPTAIRMLERYGPELAQPYDFSRLRLVASVGEPLDPESVRWGAAVLGKPVRDTWWQTETGSIMLANLPSAKIKPGSMGQPVPGVEAAIVQRREEGPPDIVTEPGVTGELALRAGWASMFRGYLGDEERYRRSFAAGWYLTGDLARRDDDGYYWFVGRADDVIKSAGHLIGPVEVENVFMQHPAVAEVGVAGRPDAVAGHVVKAFVVLKPGHNASDDLRLDLSAFARQRLGPVVAPKEIEFRADLPKTESGKIVRRLLEGQSESYVRSKDLIPGGESPR